MPSGLPVQRAVDWLALVNRPRARRAKARGKDTWKKVPDVPDIFGHSTFGFSCNAWLFGGRAVSSGRQQHEHPLAAFR